MKTRQPELRAIPQFDSGRWKLRLERVPIYPDNHAEIGIKPNRIAQKSGWNLSCWLAVTTPLLGVLLAILGLVIFRL
jgi:hypothetical protein